MDDEEFRERIGRMAEFQMAAMPPREAMGATSTFIWAVWLSVNFPDWWAEWQTAAPQIEAVMDGQPEIIEGMKQEIQEGLIDDPQEEEEYTWQSSTGLN